MGRVRSSRRAATNGDLYGTTWGGGSNGYGTVYKITPSGVLATVYSFCSETGCADGEGPIGTLIQATDGNFYGTTSCGGVAFVPSASCISTNPNNGGTVYRITPYGKLTTLYSFCSQSSCADGSYPFAGLVQGTNGNFFGTSFYGGSSGHGTVFTITPAGVLTSLYSFSEAEESPYAGVIQGTDGNFYGATYGGFYCNPCGTLFKIMSNGTHTTLYNFCSQNGCPDGSMPAGPIVQDTSGAFFGTTYAGGTGGCSSGCGTVFRLVLGLGAFVETQTTSGKIGATVKVLGTDLTGTTSVTFNGTPASFKVMSKSEISTSVPPGASTGPVQVVTPGGTLSSNVSFRVP